MTDTTTPAQIKIDFVSDIMCPWCVVGLGGLEAALDNLKDEIKADIAFQPFELNPQMGPEGQNIAEHIAQKYGSTPEQSSQTRDLIKARAAEVGFDMQTGPDSRIWNSFDAHRLLHWAGTDAGVEGGQAALKKALFEAHFTRGEKMSDASALADAAEVAGLNRDEAEAILASDRYAQEVRQLEQLWVSRGISGVPAIVLNDKFLITGGQPAEVFEQALRRLLSEQAGA